MARRRRTATCRRCGRKFRICRFNAHHQQYCLHPDCVTERRRERQRQYYKKKYRDDAGFRGAEQMRCREGARRRRQEKGAETVAPVEAVFSSVNMDLVTLGLLAQLNESSDQRVVEATARRLERRGRELTVSGGSARASPF